MAVSNSASLISNGSSVDALGGFQDIISDSEQQQMIAPENLVGDVIAIDFTEADVLIHDKAKQAVGGIQQGCLLIAVRLGENGLMHPKESLVLLRALRTSPLPNDIQMRQARFDAAQRVADSSGNWDAKDVTDIFTLNLMRYTGVRCRVLGTYKYCEGQNGNTARRFSSDLDNFYSGRSLKVYKPSGPILEKLVNATNIEGASPTAKVGHIRYATSVESDNAAVYVPVTDFVAQRTALFGMTRTGKSNTVKTIASAVYGLRSIDPTHRVGQVIFDPNGEYANENPQDQGCLRNIANNSWADPEDVVTYGLFRHPHDPQRRITRYNFYGSQELAQRHPGVEQVVELLGSLFQGKRLLDELLSGESSGYIQPFLAVTLEPPPRSEGWSAWIRYRRAIFFYRAILAAAGFQPPSFPPITKGLFKRALRDLMAENSEVGAYSDLLESRLSSWSEAAEFAKSFANFIKTQTFKNFDNNHRSRDGTSDESKWSDQRLRDLLLFFNNTRGLNVLSKAREWHDPQGTETFTNEIVEHVRAGRLIVIDQSIGTENMNKAAAKDIMTALFQAQLQAFTTPRLDHTTGEYVKPPPVIVYVEEAHTLLPRDQRDMSDIWVRVAKEGAKFNIGLAYSTQEPSTIHSHILKNTENWFIAHLNNTDETAQLSKFNDFSDYRDSIINVKEPGFLKLRTLSSRFTLPVQIDKFEAPTTEKR